MVALYKLLKNIALRKVQRRHQAPGQSNMSRDKKSLKNKVFKEEYYPSEEIL
jgi:hypothetical protein